LNVCRGRATFITMFRGDSFLTFLCCAGRPGSVLANIRRQNLHDGPVVILRLPCNPFERIDAAEAKLEGLVSPDLVNRTRITLGDLAFTLGDLAFAFQLVRSGRRLTTVPERLSREVETGGQSEARQALEQGASYIVFRVVATG
jgi:hypothetical protein